MPGKRISFNRSKQIESLELQFGGRLLALIVDLIIIKLLLTILDYLFSVVSVGWETQAMILFNQVSFLTLPIYWLYFAFLEGLLGATLGKLFTRYRITNADGTKLSFLKATVRFPLKLFSIFTLFGVLMIDVNKEKQGLHDMICGTIVRRM